MKPHTIEKISYLLKRIPEKKAGSLIDFIDFLRWNEDSFNKEENQIILASSQDAKEGKGVNWRDVRTDV